MTISRFSYIFVLSSYNIWKKWRKISHLLQIIIQVIRWPLLEPKMFTILCIFECNIPLSTCYCTKDFKILWKSMPHLLVSFSISYEKKNGHIMKELNSNTHKNCEFTFRLTGIDMEYMYYLPKNFLLDIGLSCSIFL